MSTANTAIFRRLLWKEFRTLCGFWIAMVVLSLILLVIPLASKQGILGHISDSTAAGLYYLTAFFVALYAAGCGAMLFSSERETRTYWFLCSLPATSSWLLVGKTVFATASSLLIFMLISSSALYLGGFYLSDTTNQIRVWIVCLAATLVGLAWGVFFSLLSKRPLVATLLAVSAASVCVNGAAMYFGERGRFSLDAYYDAVPTMLVIFCLVAVADVVLGRRWLSGIDFGQIKQVKESRSDRQTGKADTTASAVKTARSHAGLYQLVWQQLRESRSTIGALAVATVPLVLLTYCLMALQNQMSGQVLPMIWLMSGLMASLVGSCVFLADHRRDSLQFLAQRTARPTYVWLSRQIVWLMVLLVVVIVSFTATLIVISINWRNSRPIDSHAIDGLFQLGGFSLICILGAYAAGQLCSVVFRSGILGFVFGISLAAVLAFWSTLTAFMFTSWFWPVLPVLIGFFLATWLRMGDWMRGRTGWKPRLRVACCAILPALVISIIIPFYRVYSIPDVQPGFDAAEFARTDSKSIWDPNEPQKFHGLLKDGKKLEKAGKLDDAFDKYLSAMGILSSERVDFVDHNESNRLEGDVNEQLRNWAAALGQTHQRIEAAIRQLDDLDKRRAPLSNVIKREYLTGRSIITGEKDDKSRSWINRLPWERKRALRVWNIITSGWFMRMQYYQRGPEAHYSFLPYPQYNWSDTFMLMRHSPYQSSPYDILPVRDYEIVSFFNSETQSRIESAATKIMLALQAWKLKHGKLPESLDELTKEYPGRMPNPTLNGSHFRLFPKGIQSPAVLMRRWGYEEKEEIIPAGTPFIWMTYSDLNSYRSPQWQIGVPRQDANMLDDADREKGFQKWNYGYAVPVP
ncbi:MAG: hypothetical protein JXM70_07420 [Pirellulales bacterium]|nr:hypothetical protein [Pirellulales bacterium]